MGPESTLRQATADGMIGVPAGEIVLRDGGRRRTGRSRLGLSGWRHIP
jgi:hypothetical protein